MYNLLPLPLHDEEGNVNRQLMSYARLYEDEVVEYFDRRKSELEKYLECIDVSLSTPLGELNIAIVRLIVKKILRNPEAFEELDCELQREYHDLYSDMHLMNVLDQTVASSFIEFCPAPSLPMRRRTPAQVVNDEEEDKVVKEAKNDEEEKEDEVVALTVRFPSFQFNLADTLSHDPWNRAAFIYFMPNYRGKIEQRAAARRERVPRGKKLDAVKDYEVRKTCRPVSDYEHKRGDTNPLLEAPKLQLVLRNYQKELSQVGRLLERERDVFPLYSAVDGLNSVVVAPTGSGKTIVATHIMKMHAEKMIEQKKPYRMFFVVPTTPLVLEQATTFFNYMGHICHVEQIHGGIKFSEGNTIEKFLACEIIVITPQCLINLMESIHLAERLYVSDMTLLILDECHHVGSSSDHPYSELTKTPYYWKYDKPQVVGLSASLGVGKKGTAESAIHHIKSLCAKLNAESICTVRKCADELLEFVQPPMDEITYARRPREDDFTRKLKELMMEIRNSVHEDLKVLSTMGVTIDKRLLEWHTASMNATHAFNARLDLIKEAILNLTDSQMKSKLHRELKYLKVYSMALATNDLLPAPIALDQAMYNNNPPSEWVKKFSEKLNELKELSTKKGEEDKDMTQELRKLVREQFKRDKDSRVLIFVATRELAEQVSALLDGYRLNEGFMPEGTKCDFIISTKNKSGTETGQQNQSDQAKVLKGFKEGSIPVIVATPVAEEGLDVPQCNLIIKYNTTGGVISRTQQRGRARAKDSRCVLLVMSDSVRARELENLQAERMMDRCVGDIYKEGMDKFRIDVKKLQEQQKQEKDKEEAEREHTKRALRGRAYMFKCHTCATDLCLSEDMRVETAHYVSLDTRIWNKVIVMDEEAKSKYIDQVTQVIGKMYCSICKDTLLGKDRVNMDNDSNSRPKKWKLVASELFYIDDLSMDDIIKMQDEMRDGSKLENGLVMYNNFMEIKSRLSKKAKINDVRRKLEDAKRNRNNPNISHESWYDVEP